MFCIFCLNDLKFISYCVRAYIIENLHCFCTLRTEGEKGTIYTLSNLAQNVEFHFLNQTFDETNLYVIMNTEFRNCFCIHIMRMDGWMDDDDDRNGFSFMQFSYFANIRRMFHFQYICVRVCVLMNSFRHFNKSTNHSIMLYFVRFFFSLFLSFSPFFFYINKVSICYSLIVFSQHFYKTLLSFRVIFSLEDLIW